MTSSALEKRVAALEEELAILRRKVESTDTTTPWWERIVGTFDKDPVYQKAMKLGKEYRESQKPANRSRRQK